MTHAGTSCSAARLGLGTVQFGLNYGITNNVGRVGDDEAARMLRTAFAAGIDTLDTAALYGESEAVIGRMPEAHPFRVISKTPKLPRKPDLGDLLVDQFRDGLGLSLARLRRPALDGLMVHQAGDLLGPLGDKLWHAMEQAKAEGLVKAIGVSVYEGAEIDALMDLYPLDIVQLPLNAVDHRLLEGGQIGRLAARGIEIHARSALLQGLLTVPPEHMELRFAPLRPVVGRMRDCCAELGISLLTLLLGGVLRLAAVSKVIIGATTNSELSEVITAAQTAVAIAAQINYMDFRIADTHVLNPALWHALA